MRMTIIAGMLAVGVLTSACKTEKQKMVEEWEAKVCAAKDHASATNELLKYEKWIDEKGWSNEDVDARQAAFEKAQKCVEKLKNK